MKGFAGKVAVVTGAGSGIGRALAIELARCGASSRSATSTPTAWPPPRRGSRTIGAHVKTDRLDVTERDAFAPYADAVVEHFGAVNQIYNNAGIAFTGDVESPSSRTSSASWTSTSGASSTAPRRSCRT